MSTLTNGIIDHARLDLPARSKKPGGERLNGHANGHAPRQAALDAETLRRVAWEIGERRAGDSYVPTENHVGLAPIAPGQGFAHWRILQPWVDGTASARGEGWRDCRLVLRLYDISFIEFSGMNAHWMHDFTLPALCGRMSLRPPRSATTLLAEVGFVLRSGEFIPAARSQPAPFPPFGPSPRGGHAGLFVDGRGRLEEIGNVWDQERILRERRQPRLRPGLRVASFAWTSAALGHDGAPARYAAELATGQCAAGHEVHVFAPACGGFAEDRVIDGVNYHALAVRSDGSPLEQAHSFARAARQALADYPLFDLVHFHEWMAALGASRPAGRTALLSLSSVEATRRNGAAANEASLAIEAAERLAADAADFVLTPDWLRERAAADLS
ncbi:MAG TPA: DUF4912 domain-containing protein, partial [Gemmataceae bacterium]|nr:DUF4912 domain-containing protein [Gemmataceae bacterium]